VGRTELYVARKNTAYRVVDGQAVVLNLADEQTKLITLTTTGSVVWEAADGRKTVSQIVDLICRRFDVEQEVATADVLAFVEELQRHNLVELSESPAGRLGRND